VEAYLYDYRQALMEEAGLGLRSFLELVNWYNGRHPDTPILIPSEQLEKFYQRHPDLRAPTIRERLEEGIKLPGHIVSGLIVRKYLTVFGGEEDTFKSTMMCQLAVCVAGGIPWLGFSCEKGKVAYLVMEGTDDYIIERMVNIAATLGVPQDVVGDEIRVINFSQKPLDKKDETDKLHELLKIDKPDVAICDPVTYMISKDIRYSPTVNSLSDNLQAIAKDLNLAIIVVMHTKKGTRDTESMDDIVGSSMLKDKAASRIKVFRLGDTQQNQLHFYAKTRLSERPDMLNLVFTDPAIEVVETQLRPRQQAKRDVLASLNQSHPQVLGELVSSIKSGNPKTVRAAINDLEVEKKLSVTRVPGSATKMVELLQR
jgi:RecA-family ATPase